MTRRDQLGQIDFLGRKLAWSWPGHRVCLRRLESGRTTRELNGKVECHLQQPRGVLSGRQRAHAICSGSRDFSQGKALLGGGEAKDEKLYTFGLSEAIVAR